MLASIKETLTAEAIAQELSNLSNSDLENLGYDSKKLNAGSVVYLYNCMKDYYNKNKARIDLLVDERLNEVKNEAVAV